MIRASHFLVFLIYTVPAIAIALWLPNLLPGTTLIMAGIGGALFFMIGAVLHVAVDHFRSQHLRGQEIEDLVAALSNIVDAQRRLDRDLDQLRVAFAAFKNQPQNQVEHVVAEVKVLQGLIEQLYSARSGAAPAPAKNDRIVTGRVAAAAPAKTAAAPPTVSMPPPAENLDEATILDMVREALRENNVELALQPIVSLPQRKRRHYEGLSRIRAGEDHAITAEQYITIAEQHGLITAIDNLLLLRGIQMLRKLRKTQASVGFFLNISPHTLKDRGFFHEFIQLMTQNVELASALVFEFPQRALKEADDMLWRDLERLAQLGFRFSLDQVTDLELDIPNLSRAHFRYLKLDAHRLLEASEAGKLGTNPAAFKKLLDSYAIDLIVERIENETILRELLDLQIDYGQGYLFGEPRIAKAETSLAAG